MASSMFKRGQEELPRNTSLDALHEKGCKLSMECCLSQNLAFSTHVSRILSFAGRYGITVL